MAYMVEQGEFGGQTALNHLRDFLESRWSGERSVLWGEQMVQAELKEALYCGLSDLERWSLEERGRNG